MISRNVLADRAWASDAHQACHVNPLCCEVWKVLYDSGYQSHRLLHLDSRDSRIVLRGRVGSFYLRQIAIHCAQSVDGVDGVIDCIEVED